VPLAHTLTGSLGYQLGEHDELSADVNYSTRREAESYKLLYRDLDSSRALTGLSDRLTRGTNHEFNLEGPSRTRMPSPPRPQAVERAADRSVSGRRPTRIARARLRSTVRRATRPRSRPRRAGAPAEGELKVDYVRRCRGCCGSKRGIADRCCASIHALDAGLRHGTGRVPPRLDADQQFHL